MRASFRVRALFVAFLVVLVAVGLVLGELSLRWFGLGDPILYEEHPGYRYAPRPDQRKQRFKGAWVTLDGRALRGSESWDGPADVKVLFVGDSVTWGGTGVDDHDTFADRSCRHLEQTTGLRFRCGNAGVNGYGTDNMEQRLRYKRFHDEDVIVVGIVPKDTLRGLMDLRSLPFFARRPARPFSALWEAAAFVGDRIRGRMRFQAVRPTTRDHLEVSRQSLERLYDRLRDSTARGKRVYLLLSPPAKCVGGECPFLDAVEDSMRESGFPVIDPREALRASGPEGLYVDNVHLSVAGHAVYARIIADSLAGGGPGPSGAP